MNKMKMPGFTAESTLVGQSGRYASVSQRLVAELLIPALTPSEDFRMRRIWVCYKCLGSCTPEGCKIGPCFKTICTS